jgi:hypothetical protein
MPFSCASFSESTRGGSSHSDTLRLYICSIRSLVFILFRRGRITQCGNGSLMSSSALSSVVQHANERICAKSPFYFSYSYMSIHVPPVWAIFYTYQDRRDRPADLMMMSRAFLWLEYTRGERQFAPGVVIKSFRWWICLFFPFALSVLKGQWKPMRNRESLFARRLLGKSKSVAFVITQNAPGRD